MDQKTGQELILRKTNAFHERYSKAYGQMILRLDDDTYLMTRENLTLSDIKESDMDLYDIKTGDIGKILKARRGANAMIFACTEASVLFSNRASVMNPALDDLAQIIGPDVRVSPDTSAKNIIRALKDRKGCFIKGSGIFALGGTLDEAISAVRILEKSAEAEMFSDRLHGLKYLSRERAKQLSDYYDSSYSQVNKEGHVEFVNIHGEEFELRNRIIECCKKMSWDDLVQGTWGNVSIRLNDREMLITPSGMDYFTMKTEDIVKVDLATMQYGDQRVPSSECGLHAGIYAAHPEYRAIIHTHSNGCSVFAAANAGFRIENPEMHDLIGDIHVSEPAMPGTPELVAAVLNELQDSRACIIANHGAVFCGENLDLTLAIANAVESKACNLLGFGSRQEPSDGEQEVQ